MPTHAPSSGVARLASGLARDAWVLTRAAWAPVLVFGLHHVLSTLFGHEPYVDPAMHFSGGAAIAIFVWIAVPALVARLGALTPTGRALLAFSFACTAAVVWELGEFMKPLLQGGEIDSGLANVMRDLSCGMLGAFLVTTGLVRSATRSAKEPRFPSLSEST